MKSKVFYLITTFAVLICQHWVLAEDLGDQDLEQHEDQDLENEDQNAIAMAGEMEEAGSARILTSFAIPFLPQFHDIDFGDNMNTLKSGKIACLFATVDFLHFLVLMSLWFVLHVALWKGPAETIEDVPYLFRFVFWLFGIGSNVPPKEKMEDAEKDVGELMDNNNNNATMTNNVITNLVRTLDDNNIDNDSPIDFGSIDNEAQFELAKRISQRYNRYKEEQETKELASEIQKVSVANSNSITPRFLSNRGNENDQKVEDGSFRSLTSLKEVSANGLFNFYANPDSIFRQLIFRTGVIAMQLLLWSLPTFIWPGEPLPTPAPKMKKSKDKDKKKNKENKENKEKSGNNRVPKMLKAEDFVTAQERIVAQSQKEPIGWLENLATVSMPEVYNLVLCPQCVAQLFYIISLSTVGKFMWWVLINKFSEFGSFKIQPFYKKPKESKDDEKKEKNNRKPKKATLKWDYLNHIKYSQLPT